MKRRGNRRYYLHLEVVLVRKIRQLLYEQGYTIQGARQQLDAKHVAAGVVDETESFQLEDNATELDAHDDNSFAFEDGVHVETSDELEPIVLVLEEAKVRPAPSSKIFGLDAVITELKAIRALLIGGMDK